MKLTFICPDCGDETDFDEDDANIHEDDRNRKFTHCQQCGSITQLVNEDES